MFEPVGPSLFAPDDAPPVAGAEVSERTAVDEAEIVPEFAVVAMPESIVAEPEIEPVPEPEPEPALMAVPEPEAEPEPEPALMAVPEPEDEPEPEPVAVVPEPEDEREREPEPIVVAPEARCRSGSGSRPRSRRVAWTCGSPRPRSGASRVRRRQPARAGRRLAVALRATRAADDTARDYIDAEVVEPSRTD